MRDLVSKVKWSAQDRRVFSGKAGTLNPSLLHICWTLTKLSPFCMALEHSGSLSPSWTFLRRAAHFHLLSSSSLSSYYSKQFKKKSKQNLEIGLANSNYYSPKLLLTRDHQVSSSGKAHLHHLYILCFLFYITWRCSSGLYNGQTEVENLRELRHYIRL